jgi:hypothetical protein
MKPAELKAIEDFIRKQEGYGADYKLHPEDLSTHLRMYAIEIEKELE